MYGLVGGWIYGCFEGWTRGLIDFRGLCVHPRKVLPPFLIPSSAAGSVDGTLPTSALTLSTSLQVKHPPCAERDSCSDGW